MVAPGHVGDPDVDREAGKEARVAADLEFEPVGARDEGPLEQVADPPVRVGQGLGHPDWALADVEPVEAHHDALGRPAELGVEDVGRDRGLSGAVGQRYSPLMADLQIRVGDLNFSARWEAADAPATVAAMRALLPLETKLIHCRWSGESTWVPFGDFRLDVEPENHTSHPSPGQLLIYPGGISECEILFPYGSCMFSSKVGQLWCNHFATIEPDDDWQERLREMGRRVLWEGAQDIRIAEG